MVTIITSSHLCRTHPYPGNHAASVHRISRGHPLWNIHRPHLPQIGHIKVNAQSKERLTMIEHEATTVQRLESRSKRFYTNRTKCIFSCHISRAGRTRGAGDKRCGAPGFGSTTTSASKATSLPVQIPYTVVHETDMSSTCQTRPSCSVPTHMYTTPASTFQVSRNLASSAKKHMNHEGQLQVGGGAQQSIRGGRVVGIPRHRSTCTSAPGKYAASS